MQINGLGRRLTATTLIVAFKGYRGRVRVRLPRLPVKGELLRNIEGAKRAEVGNARAWAKQHIEDILRNQAGDDPYDRQWSKQRIDDVEAVLDEGLMVVGDARSGRITIENVSLKPGSRGTIFLLFDRPRETKPGTWFLVDVIQLNAKTRRVLGGNLASFGYFYLCNFFFFFLSPWFSFVLLIGVSVTTYATNPSQASFRRPAMSR